jgi:glycerol-3-phosphate acyltransferase PlsY
MQTWWFALLAVAYFVGAIPVGWILCWKLKGVDLREVGSGVVGATQVGRELNKKWEYATMALDAGKSAIIILTTRWLTGSEHAALICGLVAVGGHCYSLILRLIPIKGKHEGSVPLQSGKGVASTLGVALCFYPLPGLTAFVAWFAIKKATGYTSVASIAAVWLFAISSFVFAAGDTWFIGAAFVLAAHVIFTHRDNLRRLREGKEPKSGGTT